MIISLSGRLQSGKDTTARIIQYLTQKHNEIPLEELLNYPPLRQPPTTTWQIKKFAGKLKECVSLVTGIPLEDLEKQEVKASNLGPEWNHLTADMQGGYEARYMTVREMLQQFGTQGGRAIHPDFWVNALFADYKPTMTGDSKQNLIGYLVKPKEYRETVVEYTLPNWIIADTRFPNEIAVVERHGGIIINIFRGDEDIDRDQGHAYDESQHISERALDHYEFKYNINNNGTIPQLVEKVDNILRELEII